VVLELGHSPYIPQDNYLAELVACLSQINAGVTTGIDTSQSSHSPEHTDAMIEGLMASGRRTLYAYSGGRSDTPGYEYPGTTADDSTGIGRLRNQYFSSDDQLVTLGFGGGVSTNNLTLARHYGAPLISHTFADANAAAIAANESILGPDQTYIHTTRFSDVTYAMIANSGGNVSLAVPIEMSMQHGMPPIQQAREHGILPSLSSDVETNMSADLFTIMRSAFTLQRALINEQVLQDGNNALMGKLLTCQEVLRMGTIAGARAAHVGDKVGSLVPGKEADIIVLDPTRINCFPLNNAPGAVVTMMDTSNVKHVMVAGEFKKWDFELVGWDVNKLRRDIERSRDRVLAQIKAGNPDYLAPFLSSCCIDSYQGLGP
jgi:cytosine/adenosine deaminase-related metal-dependent hydrolase